MNEIEKNTISLAADILKDKNNLIEKAQKLADLLDYFIDIEPGKLNFDDIEVFIDFKFVTKDLPVNKEERKKWSELILMQKDKDIKIIENKFRSAVEKACLEIIKKLNDISWML